MSAKIKYSLCIFLITCQAYVIFGNYDIGTPFIESFSAEDNKTGAQNWDIAQDSRYVMYFANNDGLLEFDGFNWNIYPLPNKTIVRSVEVDRNGQIYTGGQNELGRFIPNSKGAWEYESLKPSIPLEFRDFEDVWDLNVFNNNIVFRSSGKLYFYRNNQWEIDNQLSIKFLKNINDEILVQDDDGLLHWYEQKQWKQVNDSEKLRGSTINGIIPLNKSHFLITTVEKGIFEYKNSSIEKWTTTLYDFFSTNLINCATQLYDGSIAIGTYLSGLVIIDPNGHLKYHITKNDGLLSNNISSLYSDASNNLWVGLGNGINLVKVNFPFLRIYPDGELGGTGYAIKVFDKKLYLGTSNGLFSIPWTQESQKITDLKKFVPIEGTSGQTWGLNIVNGSLILSHHKGAFFIKHNKAFEALKETGVWLMNEYKSGICIIGTYEGITFYNNQSGNFDKTPISSAFKESSRFVEQDIDDNIWISHPYRGVFKLTVERDTLIVNHYGSEDGLPNNLHNHLFKIKNEIIVCGETGIFNYDSNSNQFVPHQTLNEILGENVKIRRLFEAPNGDIWFITQDKVGLLKVTDKLLEKDVIQIEFPALRSYLNDGFELIYPYNDKHVFLTARQGFIHYLPQKKITTDSSFHLLLNEVKIYGKPDSIVFSGIFNENESITPHQPLKMKHHFDRRIRGLQFAYSASDFTNNKELLFRHQLLGFDKGWSKWTKQRIKEYTNLPAGEYSFKVQAKRLNGDLTPPFSYDFVIKQPWYATKGAKLLYVFLFCLAGILLYRLNRKKFENVREEAHQTVQRSQQEIDRLEKKNIKSQLEHKNRELVSSALHISRKNEILTQITNKLSKIETECTDESTVNQLKKLKHLLRNEEIVEEGWENIMFHFNELNGEYINELKKKHPSLSPKDLKLCTYLKMNLSTKEIASMMNVSIRSVEASRYRLRKKMNLSSNDNLTEVLMNFEWQ